MLTHQAICRNAYLPAGHALRMAHDLSLHRALDKLAESESKKSSPEDSRDMLASARIYISAYWLDSVLSYGAGRPPSGEPVDNLTSRIHHMLECVVFSLCVALHGFS